MRHLAAPTGQQQSHRYLAEVGWNLVNSWLEPASLRIKFRGGKSETRATSQPHHALKLIIFSPSSRQLFFALSMLLWWVHLRHTRTCFCSLYTVPPICTIYLGSSEAPWQFPKVCTQIRTGLAKIGPRSTAKWDFGRTVGRHVGYVRTRSSYCMWIEGEIEGNVGQVLAIPAQIEETMMMSQVRVICHDAINLCFNSSRVHHDPQRNRPNVPWENIVNTL